MGASNVAAAFIKYGGKVPDKSMVLLVYMSNTAKDRKEGDTRPPQFWGGHAHLASAALGYELPITESALRTVRRYIAPLVEIGAIEVDRRGANRKYAASTIRYRLNLSLFDNGTPDNMCPTLALDTGQTLSGVS